MDVGGALPTILSEILNLATAQPPAPTDVAKVLVIPNFNGVDAIEKNSKAEFCEAAGITEEQFDSLLSGDYAIVKFSTIEGREKECYTPVFAPNGDLGFSRINNSDLDLPNIIVDILFRIYEGIYILQDY